MSLTRLEPLERQLEPTLATAPPRDLLLLALEQLLDRDPSAVAVWEHVSRSLSLPRPPRHHTRGERRELLAEVLSATTLCAPGLAGYSAEASELLGHLLTRPAEVVRDVRALSDDELHADLFRLALLMAGLYMPSNPSYAGQILNAAKALRIELETRCQRKRALSALAAEQLATEASIAATSGDSATAREQLLQAEAILKTRRRLQDWGAGTGALEPAIQTYYPLRSHAAWLAARGTAEAAGGYLAAAERSWVQAEQLFFSGHCLFEAGLMARNQSALGRWRGNLLAGVAHLERALELFHLRNLPHLRLELGLQLACLYFAAGDAVQGSQELDALRTPLRLQNDRRFARAEGLLFREGRNLGAARQRLEMARHAALAAEAHCDALLVSLDLVEVEARDGLPRAGLAWIDDADIGQILCRLPAELRSRWHHLRRALRSDALSMPHLQALRGDLERLEAFPKAAWHPERSGSFLDAGPAPE